MKNILIWTAAEGKGPFQRELSDGRIFSDLIRVKPAFTFEFVDLRYIEEIGEYVIDGRPMMEREKAEVAAEILAVELPLGWYKAMKDSEIRGRYTAEVNAIAGAPVDVYELSSWAKQESQAREFLVNPGTSSPMLSSLALARGRGETSAELAQRIINKADAYALSYAPILGKLQVKIDAIALADTPAAVDAIVW